MLYSINCFATNLLPFCHKIMNFKSAEKNSFAFTSKKPDKKLALICRGCRDYTLAMNIIHRYAPKTDTKDICVSVVCVQNPKLRKT